jgi:hypothetical protein
MKRLNTEEKEILVGLMTQDGFRLFEEVLDSICSDLDADLGKYNLEGGTDRFLRMKSEADGARKLQTALKALKKQLKHI